MKAIVIEPGKDPVVEDVEFVDKRIGGYMTKLPSWVVPGRAWDVCGVGREYEPGEPFGAKNFLPFDGRGGVIYGIVVLLAYNEEGDWVDMDEDQLRKSMSVAGMLKRAKDEEQGESK